MRLQGFIGERQLRKMIRAATDMMNDAALPLPQRQKVWKQILQLRAELQAGAAIHKKRREAKQKAKADKVEKAAPSATRVTSGE